MPPRPLKVFLCHAHADRDTVHGLYTRLTQDGVEAWLDKAKLVGGQNFEYEIRKAVHESDVVIVCLSKEFNRAGFRQKEVKWALDAAMNQPEGEIFIIPLRLEECETLDSLSKLHWVDLFEDDGYEMLMRALRARADKIGATLQVKRSWSPRITTPRTKYQKPAEIKNSEELKEKPVYVMGELPDDEPPGKFPDGWDTEWMPSSDAEKEKSEGDEKAESETIAKSQSPLKGTFNTTTFISLMAMFFCVASVTLIPVLGSLSKKPESTPISQIKLTDTVEVISSPPSTLEVNDIPSLTSTPVITATPLPTEIMDAKGVSMVLVPAGEFTMGSNNSENEEHPEHPVYLDDFYMDIYEVTNSLYKNCVDDLVCPPPQNEGSKNRSKYYGNPEFNEYPVIFVSWYQARTYCEWRGGNLPTEAQWEKAARGTDKRIYPWGEEISCNQANYFDGVDYCVRDPYPDTKKVGSYESGKSPYDIYDMAGNVWEWVWDLYSAEYYSISPLNDPLGPDLGQYRVLRGGSWDNGGNLLYVFLRSKNFPETAYSNFGFRCAKNAP